jgi:WD40 repeat protein
VVGLLVTIGAGLGGYFLVRHLMIPARVDAGAWRQFEVPGAGCSVQMPGTPTSRQQALPGAEGPLLMYLVELKRPDAAFMVGHARISAWQLRQIPLNQRFDRACQGMLANTPGSTLASQRDITLEGHPGRECVLAVKKQGKLVVRLYLVERDFLMLLAGGTGFDRDHPDVIIFFDSFRLTPARPIRQPQPPAREQPPVRPPVVPPSPPEPPKPQYPLPLLRTVTPSSRDRVSVVGFHSGNRLWHAGVDVWDRSLGRRLTQFDLGIGMTPRSLAIVPPGNIIAAEDGRVVLRSGGRLHELMGGKQNQGEQVAVAASPDGLTVAAQAAQTLRLWDVQHAQLRGVYDRPDGEPTGRPCLAFSPDGSFLASSAGEAGLTLRDPFGGDPEQSLPADAGVTALTFNPDGKTLAVATGAGPIKLWDVTARRESGICRVEVGSVEALAFAPDGRIWDPGTGKERFHRTHSVALTLLAISPDGKLLAAGDTEGLVSFFDPVTGAGRGILRADPAGRPIQALAFSPDGESLLTGSGNIVVGWRLDRVTTPPGPPLAGQPESPAPEGKTIEDWLVQQKERNASKRREAARNLSKYPMARDRVVPVLISLLDDQDKGVRLEAACALMEIGKPDSGFPTLRALLADSNDEIRREAAQRLGKFGPLA